MDQMDKTLNQRMKAGTPRDIPHIKLQPVDSDLAPSPEYKTIPTVRRELLTQFEDIGQNEVVLEELLAEAADMEALDPLELEEWKGSGVLFFSKALCNYALKGPFQWT